MNVLIPPVRTALLQRGCTDASVEDALKLAHRDTPDESDLFDWLLELYELDFPIRRAMMELSQSMRAEDKYALITR